MDRMQIENYFKNIYTIYEQKSFQEFVETCLSYNVRIGDYNKNIIQISKKIFEQILSILPESKSKFSYKEFKFSYKINLEYNLRNNPTPEVIIDVPVFENNYEKITIKLLKFFIENKINSKIKLMKVVKNPLLQIRVDDVDDAKMIIKFFKEDEEIENEVKSRVIPILPQVNLLGISAEYRPYNFKNFYFIYLYEYYSKFDKQKFEIENFSILNDYLEYILNRYKTEKKLNKKRMLLIIYKSLDTIVNNKDVLEMFNYNSLLDIGSINVNEFDLKLDNDKMIYFENKDDKRIISFGSEDYLNAVYSKFYENVIKNEENNTFYSYFYSIYSKILSENYKNIDKYLDFTSVNNDHIYQLMMLISSAFFAYKKMNFSLEDVNNILKIFIKKKYNVELVVKNTENFNKKKEFVFPLSVEYGNKVVDTFDHKKTTMKEYIKQNNVLDSISLSSIVYMKDGRILKGEDFLKELYKYIYKYENFLSLRNDLINLIEYK